MKRGFFQPPSPRAAALKRNGHGFLSPSSCDQTALMRPAPHQGHFYARTKPPLLAGVNSGAQNFLRLWIMDNGGIGEAGFGRHAQGLIRVDQKQIRDNIG